MKLWTFGRAPKTEDRATDFAGVPDWKQADVRWIKAALARTQALPHGGWYVIDASRNIGDKPKKYVVDGKPIVVWRGEGVLRAAPDACPHMGASMSDGHVSGCKVVCPWHGLALGDEPHGKWRPFDVHDDGVLFWIRFDEPGVEPLDKPVIAERPERFVDAVVRMEATCETQDVIANRLDPWHGAHFHPHSFGRLRMLERTDDTITVRVVYRLVGQIGVEVDATFHCPDPRTIVMTIIDGEGVGSVVETHATPVGPGRTAVIEATLATSERAFFRGAILGSSVLRPLIHLAARRLWVEDAAYAERRYQLRSGHR